MTLADLVSIVIPCYNEEQTIGLLLDALYHQSYPRSQMEIILADGQSSDRTREVVANFQNQHPDFTIRVIENPQRIIPAGVNQAIKAANGKYIVRLDAHSVPNEEYVKVSIADLDAQKGDNVGGLWIVQPGGPGWVAASIAVAASHPLGAGDARYRYSSQAGEVDTVPFGAFHRNLFDRIGFFDETLETNEDYEFNTRIRGNGGKIFFDPAIRTQYFARSTLSTLAKQYWRYGFWKWRMLKRAPGSVRWRQAIPPAFVLGVLILMILSIGFEPARIVLATGIIIYLGILVAFGFANVRRTGDWRTIIGFPAAIAVMHFSWGTSFLWSMLQFSGKTAHE